MWGQVRSAGLTPRVAALTVAHAAEYGFWIAAWAMVAQGGLRSSLDHGWLLGWALLLLTLIPLRLAVTWLQGQITVRAGGLLKERMLFDALRLDLDAMRHHGAGQFLGRIIEADAMESLALGGGLLGLVSVIELLAAALVGGFAGGSIVIPALLVGWFVLTAALLQQGLTRCSHWAETRLAMTDDIVERMVGHRTRLAQEPPDNWHDHEDRRVATYHAASRRWDVLTPWFAAVVPRGWLILGMAGIAPTFVAGNVAPETVAVRAGAILLAFRAFKRLGIGVPTYSRPSLPGSR